MVSHAEVQRFGLVVPPYLGNVTAAEGLGIVCWNPTQKESLQWNSCCFAVRDCTYYPVRNFGSAGHRFLFSVSQPGDGT
jgi:hypothetical protein